MGNTGEGDSWADEETLEFVKVEEKKQMSITQNGREIIGNALLFYDLINSNGLTEEPVQNSIIVFHNHEYHIESCDNLYDEKDTPHHYEVLLK